MAGHSPCLTLFRSVHVEVYGDIAAEDIGVDDSGVVWYPCVAAMVPGM